MLLLIKKTLDPAEAWVQCIDFSAENAVFKTYSVQNNLNPTLFLKHFEQNGL